MTNSTSNTSEQPSTTIVLVDKRSGNAIGIASFVLGVISIFALAPIFVPIALLLGAIGVIKRQFLWSILGILAAVAGFATSPILLGIVGLVSIGVMNASTPISELLDPMSQTISRAPAVNNTTSPNLAVPAADVIATVNGLPITKQDFAYYIKELEAGGDNDRGEARDTDRHTLLDNLIVLEIMRQEGINKGLNKSQSVVTALNLYKSTYRPNTTNGDSMRAAFNQHERSVIAYAANQDFLANNPVGDEQARKVYGTEIGKPATEYNARHILLKTRDDAELVIRMLDNGVDFSTVAKKQSIDGSSASTGGKLGWFTAAQMVQPFSDAVAKLQKGSYTKEPVQTQFGWHVILLDDSRESTPPSFDKVKDRLKVLVANQQLQQHIQQLRDEAKIEITAQ